MQVEVLFFVLLVLQIIFGAFVAGLDAGLTHNSFPKMGQSWLPQMGLYMSPWWKNFLENPIAVQFVHRTLGWSLVFTGLLLAIKARRVKHFKLRRSLKLVVLVVLGQFTLGVLTLVNVVPLSLASLHQIGALVLFLSCINMLFYSLSIEARQA